MGGVMKLMLSGFLFLLSMSTYAVDSVLIMVDPTHPQFVVSLPSNPTTGYQWSVKNYDKNRLTLLTSRYVGPKTKRIGAGGVMTFTFAPMMGKSFPKQTLMVFTYARPWDPSSGTQKKIRIHFVKKVTN
jgi:inhibitor of cysteine peptidase